MWPACCASAGPNPIQLYASAFGRSVPHVGYVVEDDSDAVHHVHDRAAQRGYIRDEVARIDESEGVALVESARWVTHVRYAERPCDFERRRLACSKRVRIQLDANHAGTPPDHLGAVRLWQRLKLDLEFLGDAAQGEVVDGRGSLAPERRDHDRDIVDLDGLHHPRTDGWRDLVRVRVDLVVDLDEAVFAVFSDPEAYGDDGASRERHGVDVLDPVDLREKLLDPGRHLALDLVDGQSRSRDVDVRHGHDDLRLLLARSHDERDQAGQDRQDDEDRRQPALEEEIDDAREPRSPTGRIGRSAHSPDLVARRRARACGSPPAPHRWITSLGVGTDKHAKEARCSLPSGSDAGLQLQESRAGPPSTITASRSARLVAGRLRRVQSLRVARSCRATS